MSDQQEPKTKIRVLDDAARRRLAGLLPFRAGATARITLEEFDFLDEAIRPWFTVAAFSQATRDRIADAKNANAKEWAQLIHNALRDEALKGWGNVTDLATGEPVEFSKEAVDEMRNSPLLVKLYVRVAEFSGLLEPEREGLRS